MDATSNLGETNNGGPIAEDGWRLQETAEGLRLAPVVRRALGSRSLTWMDLLATRLSEIAVYALYFPSRFDLAVDDTVRAALESFGAQTSALTSVNFWDPTDPEFGRALGFFDLKAPPALVLCRGLHRHGRNLLNPQSVYAIIVNNPQVLGDRDRLAKAVNGAHEVLARGDATEIAHYIRNRDRASFLAHIAALAHGLQEEILLLKPKLLLPSGVGFQIGG